MVILVDIVKPHTVATLRFCMKHPKQKIISLNFCFSCPFKTNSGIYEGINQQIDRAFSRLATASFLGELTCLRWP